MAKPIIVACAVFLSCSCGAAQAQPRTHVLFTVDVESYAHGDPGEQIWGEIAGVGERWGITRIMDVFEAHGLRATFYVNVYEAAAHGADSIRRAAREIHGRGHDVQLHTHPAPMFEMAGMDEGDLARQEEVLRRGIELLREWTGKTVIAHRAGGFRANRDTLKAARHTGLAVDSSFAAIVQAHYPTVRARNTVQVTEGMIRLPVTFYHQVALGSWGARRLVDLEAASERELRAILDQAAEGGLCAVNILMHSFSLSREGRADPAMARRLDTIVAYAKSHPRLEVVTTTTLHERVVSRDVCAGETEIVPVTGWFLTFARAVEDFDRGWKNKAVVIAAGCGAAMMVSAAVLLLLRYSQRRTRRP